jgi:hypothetical protein
MVEVEYSGMDASELVPVKALEAKNAECKWMYAELALDNAE